MRGLCKTSICSIFTFIKANDLKFCTRSYSSCVYHMMRFKGSNGKVCKIMTSALQLYGELIISFIEWIPAQTFMLLKRRSDINHAPIFKVIPRQSTWWLWNVNKLVLRHKEGNDAVAYGLSCRFTMPLYGISPPPPPRKRTGTWLFLVTSQLHKGEDFKEVLKATLAAAIRRYMYDL